MRSQGAASTRAPFRRAAVWPNSVSTMSVDLPDPETPVTQVNRPSGICVVTCGEVVPVARRCGLCRRGIRAGGMRAGHWMRAARGTGRLTEAGLAAMFARCALRHQCDRRVFFAPAPPDPSPRRGRPPGSPPRRARPTITVLPRSRSCLSVASRRRLSRWCRPIEAHRGCT